MVTKSLVGSTKAIAGRPVSRRTMWSVTVLSCAYCGHLHNHRVADARKLFAGELERACPVTGRTYPLEVAA